MKDKVSKDQMNLKYQFTCDNPNFEVTKII